MRGETHNHIRFNPNANTPQFTYYIQAKEFNRNTGMNFGFENLKIIGQSVETINSNSVVQQRIRVMAKSAQRIIRITWALRCMSRCPDQEVSLKREPQCSSPRASLILIYRAIAS
ncbi:hypothetical protein TNCV_2185531 [Trichonephila clavipes]|nr:hypothetical protein TNCV_2185531 [Trichonephila clavipes]